MGTVPVSQGVASQAASAGSPQVRASIARAAERTGNDFSYLLAQARLESSLNPMARAGTSSASGLYQFTGDTWARMLDRHGAEHGLGWTGAALRDPALRAQAMALRFDPDASALMAGELANDNRAGLTTALGRAPDDAELYLAHFLGLGGATQFLSAMDADPSQSAAALLPKAAAANRGVFYDGAGSARSLGAVMDLLRGRLSTAMGGAGMSPVLSSADYAAAASAAPAPQFTGGPIAREFQAAAVASVPAAPAQRSMADTLRATFADAGGGAPPAHVSAAYARLAALGL